MSDYTKTTDFAAKTSANEVLGAELQVEFNAIQTAINSKQTIPLGKTVLTTAVPGTVQKALYPRAFRAAQMPDLTVYGDSSLIFVTAPSGTQNVYGLPNMAAGALLPIMMATGSAAVPAFEASAGFYLPAFDDTQISLLLHFDGSDGATTTTDESSYTHTVDIEHNTTGRIEADQSKFGGTSWYSGSSPNQDYVEVTDNAVFDWTTEDFCVEFWIRRPDSSGAILAAKGYADSLTDVGATASWVISQETTSGFTQKVRVRAWDNSNNKIVDILGSAELVDNTWTHIAFTRSGSTFRLFQDGVLQDSDTSSAALRTNNYAITLNDGRDGVSSGGGIAQAYYDEFRIVTGRAVYTSTFTPASAAFSAVVVIDDTGPGTGTGSLPWLEFLRVGSSVYVLPDQHMITAESTETVWTAA